MRNNENRPTYNMPTESYTACLKLDGSAIYFDEVIAIYMNMFQFTNFTYYK